MHWLSLPSLLNSLHFKKGNAEFCGFISYDLCSIFLWSAKSSYRKNLSQEKYLSQKCTPWYILCSCLWMSQSHASAMSKLQNRSSCSVNRKAFFSKAVLYFVKSIWGSVDKYTKTAKLTRGLFLSRKYQYL